MSNAANEVRFEMTADSSKLETEIKSTADNIQNKIQQILNDTTKNAQSKAMSLASIYKQSGMNQSEAMKKAWEQIERTSDDTSSKIKNNYSKLFDKLKSSIGNVSKTFTNSSKKIKSDSSKTSASMADMFKGSAMNIKAMFDMVIGSIRAVMSNISGLLSAYQTQIESEKRLEATMKNSTSATQEQIQSIKDLASELQGLGVVGDEVQLAGMQELATYVGDVESLKTMLPVLNDMIAQQYGYNATTESAVTISTMLGKVLNGQTSALSRYGYSFTEAQEQLIKYGTEEQKVATLAEVVSASVAGVNATLANTPTGKIKQLSNNFGDLKETLGGLITNIIYPIVKYLDIIVQKLNTVFSTLNVYIKQLFGIEDDYSGVTGITDSAEDAADAVDETTDAVDELKKATAGFDQLNIIKDDSSTPSTNTDTNTNLSVNLDDNQARIASRADKALQSFSDTLAKIKSVCQPVLTSISNLWDKLKTIANFKYQNIQNFYNSCLKPLGKWVLGTGLPKFVDIISNTLSKIDFAKINIHLDNLYKSIEPFAENIGNGLLWFIENVLSPLAVWVANEAVPVFLDLLSAALDTVNAAINAVKPLFQVLFNEILKPLAEWTGGIIVSVLENVAAALGKISEWINNNQTTVQVMTVTVGAFFAAWKGIELMSFIAQSGGVVKALGLLKGATFGVIAAKLKDKAATIALKALYAKDFIVSVAKGTAALAKQAAGFVANTAVKAANTVATTAMTVATGAWNTICTVATAVTTAFGAAMTFLTSPIGLVIVAITAIIAAVVLLVKNWDWVKEKAQQIWEAIKEFFNAAWEGIKNVWSTVVEFFQGVWDGICNVFSAIGEWFSNIFTNAWNSICSAWSGVSNFFSNIWNGIKSAFSAVGDWFKNTFKKAWEGVKNVFSTGGKIFDGIKDGIANVFKTVVNGIIGGINKVISIPFNAINKALEKIKGINIMGVKPFDWINPINVPQIPKLAKGGLVKAPTLAIVGDNRNASTDPEVIAPLSKLQNMIDNNTSTSNTEILSLLRSIYNLLSSQDITLINKIYLDSDEIANSIEKLQRKNARRGVTSI